MIKTALVLTTVCALPLMALNTPVYAAAAHNIAHGTDSTNANDASAAPAPAGGAMMPHHMKKKHMMKKHM